MNYDKLKDYETRNKEIYQMRKNSKFTYKILGEMYGLTGERIRFICAEEKVKEYNVKSHNCMGKECVYDD